MLIPWWRSYLHVRQTYGRRFHCGMSAVRLPHTPGGDQSKYYTYWQGTAVSDALSSSHVVVGGSSAGLAVQGNFIFGPDFFNGH